MPLKVELKPGERVILGQCLVTNDGGRTRLKIEGDVPILREKDIMTPQLADSPAKAIYLLVQAMYLSGDVSKHYQDYFKLVRDLIQAAPSTLSYVDAVNNWILTGNLYKALKEAHNLIDYEQELIRHASGGKRLLEQPEGGT